MSKNLVVFVVLETCGATVRKMLTVVVQYPAFAPYYPFPGPAAFPWWPMPGGSPPTFNEPRKSIPLNRVQPCDGGDFAGVTEPRKPDRPHPCTRSARRRDGWNVHSHLSLGAGLQMMQSDPRFRLKFRPSWARLGGPWRRPRRNSADMETLMPGFFDAGLLQ